jgi:hypothetical protein
VSRETLARAPDIRHGEGDGAQDVIRAQDIPVEHLDGDGVGVVDVALTCKPQRTSAHQHTAYHTNRRVTSPHRTVTSLHCIALHHRATHGRSVMSGDEWRPLG